MNRILPVLLSLLAVGFVPSPALAAIFGVESCGSSSAPCNASSAFVRNGGSMPPAYLFSFQPDGTGFTNHGAVTLSGSAIDVDGLAMRSDGTLFAFELMETVTQTPTEIFPVVTGSRLISLGSGITTAAAVGTTTLTGREIRGAVFDAGNNLWVLDAQNNELLRIDLVTGGIVAGSARNLSLSGSPFDLHTISDLAIHTNGMALMSSLDTFYRLSLATGELTSLFSDTGNGHSGLAFDPFSPASLLTHEVTGFDDLYAFDTSLALPIRENILLDFIPSNNAGRGDLASLTLAAVPESETYALMLVGIGLLGFVVRRRKQSAAHAV